MKHTARLLAMLLAVALLLGLCACGGGKDETQEELQTRPTTYDGQNSLDAVLDYAYRLEAAGNAQAAALVRSRIPQAAAGEANQKIEEFKQSNEDWQLIESIEDAMRIADALAGGGN